MSNKRQKLNTISPDSSSTYNITECDNSNKSDDAPTLITSERNWQEKYNELKQHHQTHGHIKMLRSHNLPLANWIQNQRCRCTKEHRINLLKEIGFFCNDDDTAPSERQHAKETGRNWQEKHNEFKQHH